MFDPMFDLASFVTFWGPLAGAYTGGIVWGTRLEGRVNSQQREMEKNEQFREARHVDLVRYLESRHQDLVARLDRIETKVDANSERLA